jgi:very-short-patch-repair endonuclease
MSKRMTTEEFIAKAKALYGEDKYDYSKVDYVTNEFKVCIICPVHGEIMQKPQNHYRYGCYKCAHNYKMDTTLYVKKAQEVHGDRYDYSELEYTGSHNNVKIGCRLHGFFFQSATAHLSKRGCPACGSAKTGIMLRLTQEEFIERSKIIHNDAYDYSLVKFEHVNKEVEIICQVHGVYLQKPTHHLRNKGCRFCNESWGEKAILKFLIDNDVYFIRQKTFKECKNKRKLPFDFYLPNEKLLIEFNGRQHYNSVEYFGGNDKFLLRKRCDEIKKNFAITNGFIFMEIKYDEISEIENILKKYIK